MSSKKRSAKKETPGKKANTSTKSTDVAPKSTDVKPSVNPLHPSLTDEETLKASKKQIAEFPTVIRVETDLPVPQQSMGLISIKMLNKPIIKDKATIYGFMKIRGNWADKSQAEMMASRIIKEQDSANVINIVPVGVWFPMTEAKAKEVIDVNLSEKEHNEAHKIALKETEEHNNLIQQQLKDRAKEVKDSPDYNEEPESLNHYTLKRVALMFATENITIQMTKMEQLKKQRLLTIDLIKKLDEKHPEYKERWIDNYNIERKKAGIPDFVPSEYERERYTQEHIGEEQTPKSKEESKK